MKRCIRGAKVQNEEQKQPWISNLITQTRKVQDENRVHSTQDKEGGFVIVYTSIYVYWVSLKSCLTCTDSTKSQGNGLFQDRHIDIAPDLLFGRKPCNSLSNLHIFGKNNTKDSVYFFPLIVISQADEELRAGTNPRYRPSPYGWTDL